MVLDTKTIANVYSQIVYLTMYLLSVHELFNISSMADSLTFKEVKHMFN